MACLIDTCVIYEIRHPRGARQVKAAVAALDPASVFLSVVTLGEIAAGIDRLDPGSRREALEVWLVGLQTTFENRILDVTRPVARRWGEFTAEARRNGRTLAAPDGLIAATASVHGLAVMTRNRADFQVTGVPIVDPWEDV
ncbi:MAG: type II toxin-antitoxin system VapC family toxin [Pseudomonadota bacterium]